MQAGQRRRLTRVGVGVLVVALVAIAGVAGVRAWREADRTSLQQALRYTSTDAERFAWTDWAAVREALGVDLDATSTNQDVADLMSAGYDADLTSASAMGESAEVVHDDFGFSPATVSWELLAQATGGSVLILGVPEDFDFETLTRTWSALGYQRPDSADDVWVGGDTALARVAAGRSVSPQFSHLLMDADRRLILAGDNESYLRTAEKAVAGGEGGDSVDEVAATAGEAVSAILLDAEQACRSLAMSAADELDQATAQDLIARAGKLNPLTGFSISAQPGGSVVVAMSFETDEQAKVNADTRAALASGPAPGQGGDFADRFTLGEVTASGTVVRLDLEPVAGAYVLSDLSSGPVLFATC